jgi:hypothetical protein
MTRRGVKIFQNMDLKVAKTLTHTKELRSFFLQDILEIRTASQFKYSLQVLLLV